MPQRLVEELFVAMTRVGPTSISAAEQDQCHHIIIIVHRRPSQSDNYTNTTLEHIQYVTFRLQAKIRFVGKVRKLRSASQWGAGFRITSWSQETYVAELGAVTSLN